MLTCAFAECLLCSSMLFVGGKFCYPGGGAMQTGGRRALQADVTTCKECVNLGCTCGLTPHSQHQFFVLAIVFHLCGKIPNTSNLREGGCFNSWFQRIQFIGSWLYASASREEEPCGGERLRKKGFSMHLSLHTFCFSFIFAFSNF